MPVVNDLLRRHRKLVVGTTLSYEGELLSDIIRALLGDIEGCTQQHRELLRSSTRKGCEGTVDLSSKTAMSVYAI